MAGYNADSIVGRRAEDLAPASLAINYNAEGQAAGATAQLSGSLGATRLDGRVQLKGSLAEWRAGQVSGKLALSAADGNKLVALLSSKRRGRIGRFHLSWHDHDPRQWHARPARHLHHGQGAIAASADRWGGGIKEGILLFRQSASLDPGA